jgi:D-alanyl-D-alanine carboxypeptidase
MRGIRFSTRAAACLATVSVFVVTAAAPASGAQFSAATKRALTSIAVSGLGAGLQPGLVVGVWVPGRGSYVRTFGTSSLATGKPISVNDHFRIASITKSFTSEAILRLVDQRKLSLDSRLSAYVSGIPNGNAITIAQLLNMTSGIYAFTDDQRSVQAYTRNPLRPFSLADVVRIIQRHQPWFPPGTDVRYDDSNYYLLGAIAEKVTGLPLREVIRRQVLNPLRLRHTLYPRTSAMPRPFARGYLDQANLAPRDVTLSNPAYPGGAGAMISTLGDLKVWAKALATGSLLSPATHRAQLMTHLLSESPTLTTSYGFGITDTNGFLGHDGAILGYGSTMFYLPKARATIVVLGNNNDLAQPKPLFTAIAIGYYLFHGQFPHGL